MASARYTLDIKPEDLVQEKPRELTRGEKISNWWHYNWKMLLIVAFVLLLVGMFVKEVVFRTDPDYHIGIVTRRTLNEEALEQLNAALVPLCEDQNDDGKVVLELSTYVLDLRTEEERKAADPEDIIPGMEMEQIANQTRLAADFQFGETLIYLTDDPKNLQRLVGGLSSEEGVIPEDDTSLDNVALYPWQNCPVLAGLELGEYHDIYGEHTFKTEDLFKKLILVRRGFAENKPMEFHPEANEALYQKLIEGAVR